MHDAHELADRIRAAMSSAHPIGDIELHLTASMGVAIADADAAPESLLGDSDAAMYVAKSLGRDPLPILAFDELVAGQNRQPMAPTRPAVPDSVH